MDRLNNVGFDEFRRIIHEEEPPRPSSRLNTLSNELATTISTHRPLEASRLRSLLAGDLDWIVMKALDKARNRRYRSAAAFAEDINRFLDGLPVEARPPSTLYRFSKFARRNKVVLTTVTLIATALILGTTMSIWQATVATNALEQARIAETQANISRDELEQFTQRLKTANALLTSGRAYVVAEDWANAHDAYTEATEVQPRYFTVWQARGSLYAELGLWELAAADFAKAIELGCPVDGAEFLGVAQVFIYLDDARLYQRLATDLAESNDGSVSTRIRGQLIGKPTEPKAMLLAKCAEQLVEERFKSSSGRRSKTSKMPRGAKLYIAGWAHLRAGNIERAIERLEQSDRDEPDWPGHGISYPLLAIAYQKAGRTDDARNALRKSQQAFDGWLDESIEKWEGRPPIPWFDWIEFLINHREATLMIDGDFQAADSRLAEQKRLSEAAIQ